MMGKKSSDKKVPIRKLKMGRVKALRMTPPGVPDEAYGHGALIVELNYPTKGATSVLAFPLSNVQRGVLESIAKKEKRKDLVL